MARSQNYALPRRSLPGVAAASPAPATLLIRSGMSSAGILSSPMRHRHHLRPPLPDVGIFSSARHLLPFPASASPHRRGIDITSGPLSSPARLPLRPSLLPFGDDGPTRTSTAPSSLHRPVFGKESGLSRKNTAHTRTTTRGKEPGTPAGGSRASETSSRLVHFEGYRTFTLDELLSADVVVLGMNTYGTMYKAHLEMGVSWREEEAAKNFVMQANLLGKIRYPNLLAQLF